ncbi:sigma-54-dependent Fis family transcriptional regulator [Fusibacter sp. 3D3]|uniref:sigma-54 interaction domain-containing protein n=1 Tax=Fusibacter sp. 3D3 TaxID=1048380 RepID=UPI0008530565|nr:sigma 54-interacting transcriptional regulator [Fusibacter sp. 3D3]GAU78965.1 response regulator of zinc sigma-54-dependent two-component system [Fusibacter sp. 3D3]
MNVISMPFLEKIDIKAEDLMNYETILDALDEGVCLFDHQGHIKFVNDQYCKLFRMSKERAVDLSLYKGFKDELSLKCLKFQKKFEGKINYHIGNQLFYSKSYPVFKQNAFLGVLTTYDVFKTDYKPIESVEKMLENPFKDEIIGDHPTFVKELVLAYKASKSNTTIMIRGESGTGKELVAKSIHKCSKRVGMPFVAVNCAAIPVNLMESELFGYVQGAFTGANKSKIGKFELANGGTLFLDEIGDLPLDLQAKLLRVIQEREIEKIGSNHTIPINVRIITATHCPLEKMVEEGTFRADLFYRLNVIPVSLPSLKERMSDIPMLIHTFMETFRLENELKTISITDEAMMCLKSYAWPGNIRELKNTIERLVVLSSNCEITIRDIPVHISETYQLSESQRALVETNSGELYTYESYDKEIIRLALKQYKSFNLAGKALGLTHKTVAAKARKYNLVD